VTFKCHFYGILSTRTSGFPWGEKVALKYLCIQGQKVIKTMRAHTNRLLFSLVSEEETIHLKKKRISSVKRRDEKR